MLPVAVATGVNPDAIRWIIREMPGCCRASLLKTQKSFSETFGNQATV